MPCYNSQKYISQSIDSVLNQTHQNFELLICDDSSTDKSLDIIKDYQSKDSRVQLFLNKYDKGAPGARNTCLDEVSGDFVCFLDSDDLWLEDRLEKHIAFMIKNDVSFSYSYNNVINEAGEFICQYMSPDKVDAKKMRFANFIHCSTAIYNFHVVGHIHQPNIKKRNDFALWLKILNSKNVSTATCFKEVTSSYRANSYGLSSNRLDAAKYYYKCLVEFNNCSRLSAFIFLIWYIGLVLVKKKWPHAYNYIICRLY